MWFLGLSLYYTIAELHKMQVTDEQRHDFIAGLSRTLDKHLADMKAEHTVRDEVQELERQWARS